MESEISSPSLQQHSTGSVDRSIGWSVDREVFYTEVTFEQSYSGESVDVGSPHKAQGSSATPKSW